MASCSNCAEQGHAGDGKQPPLVPRCGRFPRLMPGVGLLGAVWLPGVAQRKSRPGMTASCPTPGVSVVIAVPPAPHRPHGRCGPDGGWAAPRADWGSRARWWVRGAHHPACRGVVVPPRPDSGGAGGRRKPVLGPTPAPGAGGVSPSPEARARRGEVAPLPAPRPGGCRRPGVGACGWRWRQRDRRPCRVPAAPGQHRGACRRRVVVPGLGVRCALVPRAGCGVSRPCPRRTGCGGLWRPGWCPRGWRRSVTGRPGPPRQSPAPQPGLAGDGE